MYANDSCHFMAARPWFTERPLLPCQLDWRQAFSCKLWAGCANQKWCDCYFQSPSFSFILQCHWRSKEGERCFSSFNCTTCWFCKSLKGEYSERGFRWQQKRGWGAESKDFRVKSRWKPFFPEEFRNLIWPFMPHVWLLASLPCEAYCLPLNWTKLLKAFIFQHFFLLL